MRFIQHINERDKFWLFSRGVKPVTFDFCSLNEFLSNSLIQILIKDKNFKRFTICRDKEYELISELKDGQTYKIGVLDGNMGEIPEWCGRKVIIAHAIPEDIEKRS